MYLLLTWLLAPLALLRLWLTPSRAEPERILLIQTAKIGDYICTTPLIRALRDRYPHACLMLLVNPLAEPLARYQPGVDRVLTIPGGRLRGFKGRWAFYRMLRREGIDCTICISPNLAFMFIPFLAGVARRASVLPNFGGRSYRLASPFVSMTEPHRQGRMLVETGLALLAQFGVPPHLPSKELGLPPGARERVAAALPLQAGRRWIGIGVSSGNKLKELGREKLNGVIRDVLGLSGDIGVVLVGSAGDRELARQILDEAVAGERIVDGTGRVSLEDLPALVERFSLYFGVDSGITYLADALGIPVVDIMGPADAEDQRPTGPHALLIHSSEPCAPCSHAFNAPYSCRFGTRACIQNLGVDMLTDKVKSILAKQVEAGK